MSVLYFTFANNQFRPLDTLRNEDDGIFNHLMEMEAHGWIKIVRDAYATVEKISGCLTAYRDQILLFHFSGHAGARLLETEKGVAFAEGIAAQLGQCKALRCVVLNGCSTRGQVAGLLRAGVPVVIATSAPVEDASATEFALGFYHALSLGNTLEEAFETGVNRCKTKYGGFKVHRDTLENFEEEKPDTPIWGIYYRRANDLSWKLPNSRLEDPVEKIKAEGTSQIGMQVSGGAVSIQSSNVVMGNQRIDEQNIS